MPVLLIASLIKRIDSWFPLSTLQRNYLLSSFTGKILGGNLIWVSYLQWKYFQEGERCYTLPTLMLLSIAGQKKMLDDHSDLAQEECKSETAENSIEEHIEGGHDADGEEMTDGIEEDFDEDGSNELVCHFSWPTLVFWQLQHFPKTLV